MCDAVESTSVCCLSLSDAVGLGAGASLFQLFKYFVNSFGLCSLQGNVIDK